MENLAVLGITNDGNLWFFNGGVGWEEVKAQETDDPGPFVSIASADATSLRGGEAVHLYGITQDGQLWYTRGLHTTWEPFANLTARIGGNWDEFQNLGAADVNGEFHLCVTTLTADGQLRILHTIRHADGTWDGFQDVNALVTFSGSFIGVACAELNKELHLCGVTDDGKLWHTIRSAQNVWLQFENVNALSTNDPGPFADVSIARGEGNLQVFAQAGGELWHTTRISQPPGWQAVFDSLKEQTIGVLARLALLVVRKLLKLMHNCMSMASPTMGNCGTRSASRSLLFGSRSGMRQAM